MAPAPAPPSSVVAPVDPPRMRRNVTALAGGQAVTWTMTLLWTFIVPRALGPIGMGVIVSGWAVAGVLGIVLGLGTKTYLVREMVVEPTRAPRLLGTAILLRVVLTPVFVVAVIAYSRFADYGPEGTLVLYLAMGATVLTLIAEPMQAAFQAVERMEYLAYSDVLNKSAQGLLGIGLVLLGFRSVGVTACWMVVSGLVVVLNARWLRPFVTFDLRTTAGQLRQLVKGSLAYWAFGLFFMLYLWIDSVMLSLMTRPEVVGWYGVPTRLFQSMLFVAVIVSTAWLPRLVGAFKEGPDRLREVARAPIELVLVLSLPIAAATAVAARPMVQLLYGDAYANAAPVMVVLAGCIPLMYLNIMLSQVLVAANRQIVWTGVMAGATIVNPVLNVFLIRTTEASYGNGAIGAALSLLLTELLIVVVGFALVGRNVLDRRAVGRCAVAAAASGAMWGAATATRGLGTMASFAAGGITFVVLAWALRLVTPEEAAAVRRGAAWAARRVPVLGRIARSAAKL